MKRDIAMTSSSKAVMSVHPFKPRKAKTDYRVVAKDDKAEIYIYGIIGIDFFGDGVTAKQFADDLKRIGKVKTIDLRINSDGGVIDDARAMYNLLVEHSAKVIVHVDGIAASAASFLAMAGDRIEIAEGGFMMIHNSRGGMFGTADDFRRFADVLEGYNVSIRDTYVARTKLDAKKIQKWMDAETWFTGREAVEHGFADKVVDNMRAAARVQDPTRFTNLPPPLRPNRSRAAAAIADLARIKI